MYKPDEECKRIIERLKCISQLKGIKPTTLAQKAGISSSTMSSLMNGKSRPQVYTLMLLCNALGISIHELFEDECRKLNVSEEEEILNCFRCLSKEKKELLSIYLDMLINYNDDMIRKVCSKKIDKTI